MEEVVAEQSYRKRAFKKGRGKEPIRAEVDDGAPSNDSERDVAVSDEQMKELDNFYAQLRRRGKRLEMFVDLLTPIGTHGILTESQVQSVKEQDTNELKANQLMELLKRECRHNNLIIEQLKGVMADNESQLLQFMPVHDKGGRSGKEPTDRSKRNILRRLVPKQLMSQPPIPADKKSQHQKSQAGKIMLNSDSESDEVPMVEEALGKSPMQPPFGKGKRSAMHLSVDTHSLMDKGELSRNQRKLKVSEAPSVKEFERTRDKLKEKLGQHLPRRVSKSGKELDTHSSEAIVDTVNTGVTSDKVLTPEAIVDTVNNGGTSDKVLTPAITSPVPGPPALPSMHDLKEAEGQKGPAGQLLKPSRVAKGGADRFEAERLSTVFKFTTKDFYTSAKQAQFAEAEKEASRRPNKSPVNKSVLDEKEYLSRPPPDVAIEWLRKRMDRDSFLKMLSALDLPDAEEESVLSMDSPGDRTEAAIRAWRKKDETDKSFGDLLALLKGARLSQKAVLLQQYVKGELSAKFNRPKPSTNTEREEREAKMKSQSVSSLKRHSSLKKKTVKNEHKLSALLDKQVTLSRPKNWVHLSTELGFDENKRRILSGMQSPTQALLDQWRESGQFSADALLRALAAIKHWEAVHLVYSRFLPKRSWLRRTLKLSESDKTLGDVPRDVRRNLAHLLSKGDQAKNWLAVGLWLEVDKALNLEKGDSPEHTKSTNFILFISGALSKEARVPIMSFCEALKAVGRSDCLPLLESYLSEEELSKLEEMTFPPEILRQPVDSNLPFGSTVTLTCLACGTPPLTYCWFHADTQAKGATWQNVCAIAGEYRCQVSNAFGKVESSVVKVQYPAPEQIIAQGETAINAYQVALKEGSVLTYRIRVMVIGQDRVGKSSLIRSILQKKFTVNDSTIGIDITSATFAIIIPTGEEGEEVDGSTCEFTAEESTGTGFCEGEVARAVAFAIQEEQRKKHLEILESQEVDFPLSDETEGDVFRSDEEDVDDLSKANSLQRNGGRAELRSSASSGIDGEEGRPRNESVASLGAYVPNGNGASSATPAPRDNEVEEAEVNEGEEYEEEENEKGAANVAEEELQLSPKMKDMVVKLLKEVKVNKEAEHVLVRFYDFAGQPVFYNTHSVFMSDRGIYLLVHDLKSDLRGQAVVRFSENGHERVIDQDCYLGTNMDYLYAWMSSVYTASGSKASPPAFSDKEEDVEDGEEGENSNVFDGCEPPVIVVGTHRDSVARRGHHNLARTIVEKSEFLHASFAGKAYNRHISRPFFFVDNSLSGSDAEDPEVILLRQRIRQLALSQKKTKQNVPVKWLKFELSIERLVQDEGVNFLKFADAAAVAQKVCGITSPDHLTVMLAFYHGLGVIVHFNSTEQLHDLVIVNPQWLVDIFKRLITVPTLDELQPEVADLWKQVVETGLLHPKLVSHIWSEQDERQHPILLQIMAKFDLVCPFQQDSQTITSATSEASGKAKLTNEDELFAIDGVSYMVPSLLRYAPPDTAFFKCSPCDAPPLCLISAIGFIPEAFFYRMVARCVAQYPVCPELYRRFARLHIDDQFSFLLFHGPFWLKFIVQTSSEGGEADGDTAEKNIEAETELLHRHCSTMLRFVLQAASEIKHQGMAGLVFSLGVSNPDQSSDSKEDRLFYVSDQKCHHHRPPLQSCAEITCQGAVTRQECVQLPSRLPPVGGGGDEDAGQLVRTLKRLRLWFSSSHVVQEKRPVPVKVDVSKEEEGCECPSITKQPPREVIVRVGDDLTLKCEARGKPAVSYQWRRGGRNLARQTSSTLCLRNIECPPAKMSFYKCVVKNKAGYCFSRATTVNFLERSCPVITKEPPAIVPVKFGEDVTLSCVADGEDLVFQWFFFNWPIPNSNSCELRIRHVCDWHDGLYMCEAQNSHGIARTRKISVQLTGEQAHPLIGQRRLEAQKISEKDFIDAEKHFATAKIALLIGNRNYQNHPPLIHPENDVIEVGHALRDVGFETCIHVNLTFWEMTNAIQRFLRLLDPGVYGLFYYAGHGFEDSSKDTYLVPVDADTSNNTRKCIRLEAIHYEMQQRHTRLITMVMDCCRTNLQVPNQRSRCRLPLASFANFVKHFSCSTRARALERSRDKNSVYAQAFSKLLTEKMPLLDFFSEVEQGVVKIGAVDKLGTYTAQRPEMRCSLASRSITLNDQVNCQHKIHDRVMRNWDKYHKFDIPRKVQLSCRWAPVTLEFLNPLSSVIVVTSLVEKNARDHVSTKFIRPRALPSGVEVYSTALPSKSPVFLQRLLQRCCPDHDCVLIIVGFQRLQEDFTLRLSVSHNLDETSEELTHTLTRSSLACGGLQLFN